MQRRRPILCYTISRYFFIENCEGFNVISGQPSPEFDDTPIAIPEGPPNLPPYTKANIRDGYVIPHESKIYCKFEKLELFSVNKIGLVQFTLVSRSTPKSLYD